MQTFTEDQLALTSAVEPVDIDDLSDDELDDLSFGVIQVDGAGRILRYNAAESRFSGRSRDRVIGRDFFRDVAPCTHLPAFHGRFLDGVRRNDLGVTFGFVFGFDQPARVEVTLKASRTPDRYWILIQPVALLEPSRQRIASDAAQDTVDRRRRSEPVDSDICEREPIHVPGSVQPHVVMLAIDPASLKVVACSDNVGDAIGLQVADVIGRTVSDVFPPPFAGQLVASLNDGRLRQAGRPWRVIVRLGPEERRFEANAHLHDERLILELEMLAERPEDFGAATAAQAQDAVLQLRAAKTLSDAATVCAEQMRLLTGFERVLVYRFDDDWNGEAVGESREETYPSLLGLRFPASDIPAQARALYVRAPARFVVDRDAVAAAVVAEPLSSNQPPVDLSLAYSRALSPIHLEYQRNLGVNGSMSVSITVEGKLWGLVIGHCRKPHYVTPESRALAGLVTDAFALRVHELATTTAWREQQELLQHQNTLLRQLAGSEDFVATLTVPGEDRSTLLNLFGAKGAVVVDGDRIATLGATPPAAELTGLVGWLRKELPADQPVFATADLSEHWSGAEQFREVASGLLAVFVDGERRNLLLWFRPEVPATINWGGDPSKPVLADTVTGTVLPRRSFERWVEERRGQAEPWASWHIDAATAFATAVEVVAIRQGRRIAELSAKQTELAQALDQKDLLAREIDHRVKNSLQIVAAVMLMQSRQVTDTQAKNALEDTYARVMSVARVHDSLQQASDAEMVDLGQTLQQLCSDLTRSVASADRQVEVEADPGLMVPSRTAVALSLIATELVTNAIKYAYAGEESGPVWVSLRARTSGGLSLTVCDEGRGLAPDWNARERTEGGLGMRVVHSLLQQIGGNMEVDPHRSTGACFTVQA